MAALEGRAQALRDEFLAGLAPGVVAADLEGRLGVKLNRLYSGLRGSNAEALALLQALEAAGAAGLSVRALLSGAPVDRRAYLETALVWLAKQGLVDWLAD